MTRDSHPALVNAFVSLGGNRGDVAACFAGAIRAISGMPGVESVRMSSIYETAAVGPIAQDDFLNAVAWLRTTLTSRELLDLLQGVERLFGRDREAEQRWGPRTLDLDLLLYGDQTINEPGLAVPHPRMTERLFVLAPLAELAPGLILPGHRASIDEICGNLAAKDEQRVTRL